MSTEFAIRIKDLGRQYGREWVVDKLTMDVPRGTVFGMLGLNGAGKTTTIRMMMGLIRRHTGSIEVLGHDPQREPVAMKRKVGYVADSPNYYQWMTVNQMCAFVEHHRSESWDRKRAAHLLDLFKIKPEATIKNLSKGQRAKVSLVLAMAFEPELLILDEPTNGLDPVARREFVEGVLAEYQESGRTVLISSHLVSELSGLVDHIGILHEGRLQLSQPADEFLATIHHVRIGFEGDVPRELNCDGLMRTKARGREAVLSVYHPDPAEVRRQLETFHPTELRIDPLDLEEAFVEYIGGVNGGAV